MKGNQFESIKNDIEKKDHLRHFNIERIECVSVKIFRINKINYLIFSYNQFRLFLRIRCVCVSTNRKLSKLYK